MSSKIPECPVCKSSANVEKLSPSAGDVVVSTGTGAVAGPLGVKAGAMAGAAIGSLAPGLGTAIGAAVGGTIGGVAAFCGGMKLLNTVFEQWHCTKCDNTFKA